MENIINKKLYLEVKNEIINKYPKHSAYRSMLIQKLYKEKGGLYKDNKNKNLNRWLDEKWINVDQYLNNNKIVKCGDNKYIKKSACRPLIRINKKTPTTIQELLNKFNKKDIIEVVNQKNKDPQNKILLWNKLKIINK